MLYIENEKIKAGFETHGAELRSLVDKNTGEEYMWCGDPAYWGRVSPILFPVVGNYRNKTSIYDGKEYHLSQHGFARDSEFEVVEHKDDSVSFRLSASDKTREVYPFDFELIVSYKLESEKTGTFDIAENTSGAAEETSGAAEDVSDTAEANDLKNCLTVKWEVKNKDNRVMYFSIGGHPAFNLRDEETYIHFVKNDVVEAQSDLSRGNHGTDAAVKQDASEGKKYITAGILEDGLLSDRTKDIEISDKGLLKPTVQLFAEDALILEDCGYGSIALSDSEGRDYLRVTYNAPVVGIWSPAGKKPLFVCIEPWFGRTDRTGYNMELTGREYGNSLEPGEIFAASYSILV